MRDWKWPIGRKVALGFGPLLLALILIGVIGRLNKQYAIESRFQVEHTLRVLEHIHRLSARFSELEAAHRSYIITGLPEYLYGFREVRQRLGSDLTALRDLTANDATGTQRLSQVESLGRVRLDAFDETLKVREQKGLAAARLQVIQGPGRQVMVELRSVLSRMVSEASALLRDREQESTRRARRSGGIALLVMILALLVSITILAVTVRGITRPIRKLVEATGHVAQGDLSQRVDFKSGDEIGTLARAFNLMADRLQGLSREVEHKSRQQQAAHQELESFSYSVSHDLRAPLRHMTGFAELLQRRTGASMDEQSQRFLSSIHEAAKRMGRLIDDLLDFSRMGRVETQFATVDMRKQVDDVARELAAQEGDRQIDARVHSLPVVAGDTALLRLVWLNLIGNALKYTRGKPRPEIEIGHAAANGEDIFFVRDNGVGFDMQYAGKLFSVFQRLHHRWEFEGTGIGLANVRRIIHRHGGRTWAEGQVGAGATFYFSLPRTRPLEHEGAPLTADFQTHLPNVEGVSK